ncbi:MAG: GAF domain-containing protein [Chloroflexota bacterium]
MQFETLQNRHETLQGILNDSDLTDSQKITAILELGLQTFGQDIAIVSQIEANDYVVQYCEPAGAIAPGTVFELGTTYCNITLTFPVPVAIPEMAVSEHNRHPCYDKFKLESYIGAKIMDRDQVYGTVNFSSADKRGAFSREDRELINQMAQAINVILHG